MSLQEINALIHDVDWQPEEWLITSEVMRRVRLVRGNASSAEITRLLAEGVREGLIARRVQGVETVWANAELVTTTQP